MSKLADTIQQAATLAFKEDAKQVVGKIDGEWAIAVWEDCGRISQMTGPQFEVYADGVAHFPKLGSMKMKSHTQAELATAVDDHYRLFEVDSGGAGEDDVLYGIDRDDVVRDLIFYHDFPDALPAGWTIREIFYADL